MGSPTGSYSTVPSLTGAESLQSPDGNTSAISFDPFNSAGGATARAPSPPVHSTLSPLSRSASAVPLVSHSLYAISVPSPLSGGGEGGPKPGSGHTSSATSTTSTAAPSAPRALHHHHSFTMGVAPPGHRPLVQHADRDPAQISEVTSEMDDFTPICFGED
jgi:hypothetical protein